MQEQSNWQHTGIIYVTHVSPMLRTSVWILHQYQNVFQRTFRPILAKRRVLLQGMCSKSLSQKKQHESRHRRYQPAVLSQRGTFSDVNSCCYCCCEQVNVYELHGAPRMVAATASNINRFVLLHNFTITKKLCTHSYSEVSHIALMRACTHNFVKLKKNNNLTSQ